MIPNEVLRRPPLDPELLGEALRVSVQSQGANVVLLPEISQRLASPRVNHNHELEPSGRSEFSVKAREVGRFLRARLTTNGHEIQEVQLAGLVQEEELIIHTPECQGSHGQAAEGVRSPPGKAGVCASKVRGHHNGKRNGDSQHRPLPGHSTTSLWNASHLEVNPTFRFSGGAQRHPPQPVGRRATPIWPNAAWTNYDSHHARPNNIAMMEHVMIP